MYLCLIPLLGMSCPLKGPITLDDTGMSADFGQGLSYEFQWPKLLEAEEMSAWVQKQGYG